MKAPGRRVWTSLALMVMVVVVDLWIVSAGRFVDWPEYGQYTDMLADAFRHRQLSLRVEPRPELLALPDPYDARANRPYRLHDAALFRGKYYLYWGPVPALLLAGAKGLGVGHVGDQHLAYLFLIGTVLWVGLLLHLIWRRWFSERPYWTLAVALLMAGLGTPVPSLLARASIYETAILGGQFFLLGGIYWAMSAFPRDRVIAWRLALAGVFWAAAIGTRISLPPLILVLAAAAAREIGRRRRPMRLATGLVVPVLFAIAGLGLYNQARFGSVTESGQRYMLAGGVAYRAIVVGEMFSPRYLVANTLNYLFAPPRRVDSFPYIELGKGLSWFRGARGPRYYRTHLITGVGIAAPYLCLAAIPLLRRFGREIGRRDGAAVALWVAGVGAALGPVLFLFYCTIRYLGDWAPLLVILSAVGVWGLQDAWADRPERRRMLAAAVVALALWGSLIGLLLGITGEANHFRTHNPGLIQRLERM